VGSDFGGVDVFPIRQRQDVEVDKPARQPTLKCELLLQRQNLSDGSVVADVLPHVKVIAKFDWLPHVM
jgi:hypothetical protein